MQHRAEVALSPAPGGRLRLPVDKRVSARFSVHARRRLSYTRGRDNAPNDRRQGHEGADDQGSDVGPRRTGRFATGRDGPRRRPCAVAAGPVDGPPRPRGSAASRPGRGRGGDSPRRGGSDSPAGRNSRSGRRRAPLAPPRRTDPPRRIVGGAAPHGAPAPRSPRRRAPRRWPCRPGRDRARAPGDPARPHWRAPDPATGGRLAASLRRARSSPV